MTNTTAGAIKGSRRRTLFSGTLASMAQATTIFPVGFSDGTGGIIIRKPCKLVELQAQVICGSPSAGQTVTFTVYKNGVASGDQAYRSGITEGASATNEIVANSTPANAAPVLCVAGDKVLFSITTSATSGTVTSVMWCVEIETDD